jgi:predicted alpha/beta hydrolase
MTLGVSPLTGTVFSGRVNAKGNLWVGQKTDVTSDFLRCLLEKAQFHGGTFEIRGGGKVHVVTVTEEAAQNIKGEA